MACDGSGMIRGVDMWWKCPYKRGGLWWEWYDKRSGLTLRGVACSGSDMIRGWPLVEVALQEEWPVVGVV